MTNRKRILHSVGSWIVSKSDVVETIEENPKCFSMHHQKYELNSWKGEAPDMIASGYHLPPYMFLKTDSQTNVTHRTGTVVEFLLWISAYSGTKLSFVDIDKSDIFKRGFGNSVTQQILKNVRKLHLLTYNNYTFKLQTVEVDVGSFLFVPKWEKTHYLDYTYPVGVTYLRFMMPYPEQEQESYRLMAIFRPMNLSVWLILLLTTLTLIAFTSFNQRYHCDRNPFELSLLDIIHRRSLYVLGILVGRSSNGNYYVLPYKSLLSIRLAVGMLVLMTIVVFNAYTSALTSFLTVPKLKPIIQSFAELASSDKYCLVQPAHSDLLSLYLNATREPYKTLGDSLRRSPHNIIDNYTEVLAEHLIKYNGVFAHTETEIGNRIGTDMMKHRKSSCRFTASKKLTNSISYNMILRKGYLYGSFVNQGIIQLRETGLIQHWNSAYLPNIDKCLTYKHQSFQDEVRGVRALTIIHLSGAFVFVLIGNAMAIVAFLLETIYWNILKRVG